MGFKTIKGKKADIIDLFFIMPMFLVIIIAGFAGLKIYHAYYDSVNDSLNDQSREITTSAGAGLEHYDYVILFIFFGLGIGVILGAFWIQTHPAFFFMSLLLLIVAIFMAPIFSNAYMTFGNDSALSTEVASYPMSGYIMEYLPLFIAIVGIIALIVTYMKSPSGGAV